LKTIAIIPARSGSKGVRHKNVAKIGAKTLLELAVAVGVDCPLIDDVYISTDSEQYMQLALSAGAKTKGLRPDALSGDDVATVSVVLDLVDSISTRYDLIVLLQPTSPLRTPDDVCSMINLLNEKQADAAVSLVPLDEPHPHKLKRMSNAGLVEPFIPDTSSEIPRQQLPDAFKLNGAIYLIKTDVLLRKKTFLPRNTVGYVMGQGINVDRAEDLILLDALYRRKMINIYGL
jgi:CMP-N,N'-diacetyllegionaminic acid synthase